MMNADPMRDTKDALILAVLPEIPFSGWTMAALAQAARNAGLDPSMAERAFPAGVADAVLHFIDLGDRRLAEDAATDGLAGLRLTGRIRWLVRRRLEAWSEHREAVRRAAVILSLPGTVGRTTRATWATADLMWHLAGDEAVDFSYYTKRLSLSAVYSSTLLCWMSDESEGAVESWSFLDRRLADLSRVPQVIAGAKKRAEGVTRPLETLLATATRRLEGRHFGVKRG
jgi:ubiquinone biosynthesis protein COQ9